ncbi:MAG: glycosyltransferase, partial [Chitinivibrionales bacterium]|nr:glycosyltransferase [Chitinivibrionales bacterium]MBD3358786.1 glycosyltransferase [Chitinivibrionales bacterium]
GDDERTAELHTFLFEPSLTLGLKTSIYGVRYPAEVLDYLRRAGINFGGWLPNFAVPEVFSRFAVTVHIPRRIYTEVLHGVPTIRPFEALACGIPLVCAGWEDAEHLFTPGKDFISVHSGEQMRRALYAILSDKKLARGLSKHGRQTILDRHTCGHRVEQLLDIAREIGVSTSLSQKTACR